VRFACRLGFAIEPATQEALEACAPKLDAIARERVGQELAGIMGSGRMAWALRGEFAVISRAIPELVPMDGFDQRNPYHTYDVLEHTARVCAGVEEFCGGVTPTPLRWAALLHDVGKPGCWSVDERGRGHFYGHPKVGADMAWRILRDLALPGDLIAEVCALVLFHDRGVWPAARSVRGMLARLDERCPGRGGPLAFQLIDLKRADALAKAPGCAAYAVELDAVTIALRREVSQGAAFRVSDLAVSGRDVIRACGIAPGPAVGERLRGLLRGVIDGELPNDREALLAALCWKR
jgi:tRNA nucleotidyltransferase (CCA-adding enzyme)